MEGSMLLIFLVFCVVFFVMYVIKCCLCRCVVHSWLLLRLSVLFIQSSKLLNWRVYTSHVRRMQWCILCLLCSKIWAQRSVKIICMKKPRSTMPWVEYVYIVWQRHYEHLDCRFYHSLPFNSIHLPFHVLSGYLPHSFIFNKSLIFFIWIGHRVHVSTYFPRHRPCFIILLPGIDQHL